jgi:hypothetical protein
METVKEIKINLALHKLRVVINSTTIHKQMIDYCFKIEANLLVIKPHKFDGMVEVVKRVFRLTGKKINFPTQELLW